MSAPTSISDEGVIYPPRTPQEAEARALELRIALHSVRWLAAEQERIKLAAYPALYGAQDPLEDARRSFSPRRIRRLRWAWKRAEPVWQDALDGQRST